MIQNELERVFIERHRARRAALSPIAGLRGFGDAALQPEFDIARKLDQSRVELLTVEGEFVLILRCVLRSELTLSDGDVPSFVRARRFETTGAVEGVMRDCALVQ